jgi:hypothetical protein
MKKNMGAVDRSIRVVLAVVFALLVGTHRVGGALAVVLAILAVVFLLTSLVSRCPLYLPFKLSTVKSSGPKSTP